MSGKPIFSSSTTDLSSTATGYPPFNEFNQKLSSEFDEVHRGLKAVKEECSAVEKKVDQVKKILEGEQGIVTRLRIVEVQRQLEAQTGKESKQDIFSILSLLVAVATLLFLVFKVNTV